ncbi:glutathione S-transferase [Camillea tinctor]|nr:glutathione S-transferase [Camillea tinctor]
MAAIPPEKAPKPGLNIYGYASVNPYKVTVLAEELSIPYNYISVDMAACENQAEWYASINPNGRMPALVHVKEDGTSVTVFESAACLLYIASEFDKENRFSYPLSWQVAGLGPMMGQTCYFNRYATEPVPYVSWRYTSECRRLHHVLDKQLASPSTSPFVGGDRMTVADIAIFIFVHSARWCCVDINEFSNVKAWHDKLAQRPAFQKGLQVPVPYLLSDDAVINPDNQEFYTGMRKNGGQMIKGVTAKWQGDVVPVPSDHANH